MPVQADDPLQKVTLNLYSADVQAMKRAYGDGWSTKVRALVHDHLSRQKVAQDFLKKQGFDSQPYKGGE